MDALGIALGLAVQELYKVIVRVLVRASRFKRHLQLLKTTVESLKKKLDKIERMLPEEETRKLINLLKKAKKLVSTCSEIAWWNYGKKLTYERRIKKLNASLGMLFCVDNPVVQRLKIMEILLQVTEMNKKLDQMFELPDRVPGDNVDGEASPTEPDVHVAMGQPVGPNPAVGTTGRWGFSYESRTENNFKCFLFCK